MHCFPDLELMGKCWLKQKATPAFSFLIYPRSSIIDKRHEPNKTLDFLSVGRLGLLYISVGYYRG